MLMPFACDGLGLTRGLHGVVVSALHGFKSPDFAGAFARGFDV
jgi:hypothetical protein